MRSPQTTIVIVSIVIAILTIAVLVSAVMRQQKTSCEVCVTFHGRTACRTAIGPTRDDAVRTAVDTACAVLASGMADSISCGNTPPDSVSCDE